MSKRLFLKQYEKKICDASHHTNYALEDTYAFTRYTNADLKISLYVCVDMKTTLKISHS